MLRAAGRLNISTLVFVGGNAFANATTSTPSCSLTSLTNGIASAPASGDLVIACVGFNNTTDRDITCTTSGYTEIVDLFSAGSTNGAQLGIFYKVLSAADTTVAFNLGVSVKSFFAVHVWRGQNATTVLDATTTTGTGATLNPPSITTVTNAAVVIVAGFSASAETYTAITSPSGMVNFFQASDTGTSGQGIAIASATVSLAGAYDPATFNGGASAGRGVTATMAVRPK